MKNNESKGLKMGPIKKFKEEGMDGMLKSYGDKIPHKQIFDELLKNKVNKEHIEKVVRYMNNLLDGDFREVLNLNQRFKGFIPFKKLDPLKNIINNLDKKEKDLLLYTALYHDIGKVISKPRHGPEGADIIKDSGKSDREKFHRLGLERRDFFLMSDLIRFHDYLAMIQTGETTYLTFVEVLCPVTNIGITEKVEKFLDYLLVLNLADIAGSIKIKTDNEIFSILIGDFEILKKAHDNISKKVYKDIFMEEPPRDMGKVHKATIYVREPVDIIPQLRAASENGACERLRRLLRKSLKNVKVGNNYTKWIKSNYPDAKLVDDWFIRDKDKIDTAPVFASLRALNIGKDFYTKFAFICKLDYALGIMSKLLDTMMKTQIKATIRKSPHDIRHDIATSVIALINTLVYVFGDFTLNDTRIGLGFERFYNLSKKQRDKLLRRLSGEHGPFKRAEALTKLRGSINMWVITP